MIHRLSLSESRIPLSGWGYELLCLLTCWFATMKIYCVAPRVVTNLCEEGMWQKLWGTKFIMDVLLFKGRDLEVNLCLVGADWPFACKAQCLWHTWLRWWQWVRSLVQVWLWEQLMESFLQLSTTQTSFILTKRKLSCLCLSWKWGGGGGGGFCDIMCGPQEDFWDIKLNIRSNNRY